MNFHIGHFGTNHLKPFTNVLKRIQVESHGCVYRGNGVLSWDPNEGFSIYGSMDRIKGEQPREWSLGTPKFGGGRLQSIRLKASNGDKAIMYVRSPDYHCLLMGNDFHLDINTLYFVSRSSRKIEGIRGHLSYQGKYPSILPDSVETNIKINGKDAGSGYHRCMDYKSDGLRIRIDRETDGGYYIDWYSENKNINGLTPRLWTRGLIYAWQFIKGSSIYPGLWKVEEPHREVQLITRTEPDSELGLLSFFPQARSINGQELKLLASFFAVDTKESKIAKELLVRGFDAADARTWHTRMHAIGTGLEGAIRTYFDLPYVPRGPGLQRPKRLSVPNKLNEFINRIFPSEWEAVSNYISDTWERVRHNAAHPHWVTSEDIVVESVERKQIYTDLVTLSRFYGFVILAMAGVPDLQPNFPAHIDKWKPAMTVTSGKPKQDESNE